MAIDNDGTVPGSPVKSPVKRLDNLQSNSSIKVQFFNPTLPKGCRFIAKLLEGARLPARALDRDAIYWFQNGGRNTKRFSQQNQFGGRRY